MSSSTETAETEDSSNRLTIGKNARWIAVGEKTINFLRSGPTRRLVEALVNARLEAPDKAISAERLVELGWPGERMIFTAGLDRVYASISRLRRMGLGAFLVTRDDGYLLDPGVVVVQSHL